MDAFYLSNVRLLIPKIKKNRSTFESDLATLPAVSTSLYTLGIQTVAELWYEVK